MRISGLQLGGRLSPHSSSVYSFLVLEEDCVWARSEEWEHREEDLYKASVMAV